jgi:thiol-disulfide isomerase/thioredoxin
MHAQAHAGATLSFQLSGLNNAKITLGYYIGGKAFRLDSVQLEGTEGIFTFHKADLKPGLFFLSSGKTRLFDFLILSPEDSIHIQGSLAPNVDLVAHNSVENAEYFAFEKERKMIEEKIKAKSQLLSMVDKATKGNETSLEPIQASLKALYQSGDSLAIAFTENHPSSLYAKMLRSVRPPEPPKKIKMMVDEKPNPAYRRWQRAHYFDNTDFKDERLLNNNFWHTFFDGFFARYVTGNPDSLIQAIDEVLVQMPKNGAFYRFAVLRLTQFFEMNEAMGADRVFVHLVDKYQKKKETPWLDIATLERLEYKADSHRPNLTGTLVMNFEMEDENGAKHALYDVEAPMTLLIFFSPLCDHCKEFMPGVYQTYLDYSPKGLKAVTLNTDKQFEYWKKFVKQQGWQWLNLASPDGIDALEKQFAVVNLPLIYLLDKDKKILVKRIRPDKLGEVLSKMKWN